MLAFKRVNLVASLFSGLLLAAAALSFGCANAQTPVGFVAQLKGEANTTTAAGNRSLSIGDKISSGEAIQTGNGARLLLRLYDDSSITLGQSAHFIVVETPPTAGQMVATHVFDFFRGIFRYVSGSAAKLSPQSVTVRTPVATVGIRGTDFVGGELSVGMPAGRPHYGFQVREGSIEVAAPGGKVLLQRPGEGTFLPLTNAVAPTPVRQWTKQEAAEVDEALQF